MAGRWPVVSPQVTTRFGWTVSVNTPVTRASPPNTLLKRIRVLERGGDLVQITPRARPLNESKGEADAVGVQVELRRRIGRPRPKGP